MDQHNIPNQIDRYEIKGLLGEGAMGQVLLGFDPKLQREVAIKIISEAGKNTNKGVARFHREARAIAALRHPNIVEIYDYSGAESQVLYLVMERLQGIDLFDLMDKMGTIPEPIVAAIGKEVCSALGEAHQNGVIHRDLKPENIYIDHNGRVVLTDFGIAKAFEEDNRIEDDWSSKTEVVGTPGFMSPEQMTGRELGPWTDFFALGAMLYNVLTRQMPFEGRNPTALYEAIKAQRFRDPRTQQPLITKEMTAILRSCLMMNPKERPQIAEDLEEKFVQILARWGVSDYRNDIRYYVNDPKRYEMVYRAKALDQELKLLKIALKDHDKEAEQACRERIEILDPGNSEQKGLSESGVFSSIPEIAREAAGQTRDTEIIRTPKRLGRESGSGILGYILVGLAGIVVTLLGVIIYSLFFRFESVGNPPPPPVVAVTAEAPDENVAAIEDSSAAEVATNEGNDSESVKDESATEVGENDENQVAASEEPIATLQVVEIQTSRKGQVWLDGKSIGKNIWRKKVALRVGSTHTVKATSGRGKAVIFRLTVPNENGTGALYINFNQGKAKFKWTKKSNKKK